MLLLADKFFRFVVKLGETSVKEVICVKERRGHTPFKGNKLQVKLAQPALSSILTFIKNWITENYILNPSIGLAIMVYEQLYHAL